MDDKVYDTIYNSWKAENQNPKLTKLPEDFYSKIADYFKRIKEEIRMIDPKTPKAALLKREQQNLKHMIKELARLRYEKLARMMLSAKETLPECLTDEERLMLKDASNFVREYQNFITDIIQRQVLGREFGKKEKSIVLRFLKDAPSVVGSNLKTYGPFKAEDVASLPVENAEILIQRGLAKKISL